jgi:hypothetical protein
MTARIAKSRQEPLGPDETFSALVTRLITTNRAERAMRNQATKAGPVLHRADQTNRDQGSPDRRSPDQRSRDQQSPDPPDSLRL